MKPTELAIGLIASVALHLAAGLGLWQAPGAEKPGMDGKHPAAHLRISPKRPAPWHRDDAMPAKAAGAVRVMAAAPRHHEHPLQWLRPVFAAGTFGARIDVRAGRRLWVDEAAAPALEKPRFRPWVPPPIPSPLPDPGQDILNRTRPLATTRAALERAEADLVQAATADLDDCRLDEMPLHTVILRSRYIRLQKLLSQTGLAPDFTYDEMRRHFLEKLHRIRRSLAKVPPDQYFDALLFHYRKDKVYEEKRGHALFNAIFFDIYNCRTGTEELAMYLSLFHPDLPLGINRGTIIRFDGTRIGHVDPAARINGRWMVFNTVHRSARGAVPYRTGELFPIEKLVLDYLPGLDAAACGLDRPLARNGEVAEALGGAGSRHRHPLMVGHEGSPIVLLRETAPRPETFAMVDRGQRLFEEMLGRYRVMGDEPDLLHPDHPYLDFLFHLQGAPARDRRDLVNLYLKNRADTAPVVPKRPLRIPGYLPGYQDLVRTLFSRSPAPEIEIVPGTRVAAGRYRSHKAYILAHNRAVESLTRIRPMPRKTPLPPAIARFALSFNGRGTTLVRPPAFDPKKLVRDLLNDRFDPPPFMENEPLRRENNTSWRRIALLKAGLAGDPRQARSALEKRVALLKTTLAHGDANPAGAGQRTASEIPGEISFTDTLAQKGETGLSPGFVKDMVELMGEGPALSAFGRYLASPRLRAGRGVWVEMFGHMDRYLLLEKSRRRLIRMARGWLDRPAGPAVRAAAAQYLARIGSIPAKTANEAYFAYLAGKGVDAAAVAALAAAGLDRARAAAFFRQEIESLDLHAAGAHQRLGALGRIVRILDDPPATERIGQKHEAFVLAFFDPARRGTDGRTPDPGGALNSLAYLARERTGAAPAIFARFVQAGANDPAALLLGDLVGRWMGARRYATAMGNAMARENARFDAALADLEALGRSRHRPGAQNRPAAFGETLAAVRESTAKITFLSALLFQNRQPSAAFGRQRALVRRLFSLSALERGFEKGAGAAVFPEQGRGPDHEAVYRAVELAGFFFKTLKKPGAFDLTLAPFIRPIGDYQGICGPTRRAVNSRSAPAHIAFTPANAYFASLLEPGNPPEKVARAFENEQTLQRLLAAGLPAPTRAAAIEGTRRFFREMAASPPCDIRRIYVFEKLLRQTALPARLPGWILRLARESHADEKAFLERMDQSGGPAAVQRDYRQMARNAFERKWGERPFSIRNLYATLLLVKTGHLAVDNAGRFVPTEKFDSG